MLTFLPSVFSDKDNLHQLYDIGARECLEKGRFCRGGSCQRSFRQTLHTEIHGPHGCWGSWQMLLLNQFPSSLKGHKEIEKCLRTGRSPVSLKFSEGNMEDPGNYCPVSLTSNPWKGIEQLILIVIFQRLRKGYQEVVNMDSSGRNHAWPFWQPSMMA